MGAAGGGPLGLLVSATILALIGIMAFSIRLFSVSFGSKLRTWCIYIFIGFSNGHRLLHYRPGYVAELRVSRPLHRLQSLSSIMSELVGRHPWREVLMWFFLILVWSILLYALILPSIRNADDVLAAITELLNAPFIVQVDSVEALVRATNN